MPEDRCTGSPAQVFLFPHVCFGCRKSFRRPPADVPRKCPDCGGPTVQLSRKFKAPRKDDLAAWRVVEYLVRCGFTYRPIYLESGELVAFPGTLREAESFVRLHAKDRS
jgi:hypothetical protein